MAVGYQGYENPDAVAKRRAMAEAIIANQFSRAPRNVGEGLNAIGQALIYRQMMGGVDKAEKAGRSSAAEAMIKALGGDQFPDAPGGSVSRSSGVDAATTGAIDIPSRRVAQAHGDGGATWLKYANEGAVRNLPLSEKLTSALSFLPELGVEMEVFSGGQPSKGSGGARVGSTRHDHGHAADVFFYKDGRKLDWANPQDRPVFEDIVRRGRAAGITGFGAGEGYMRPGSMHIGFGDQAVWGAGGKGVNAPDWLRNAYNSPIQESGPQQAIAKAMMGGETHTMPDGTVMPGATHGQAQAMQPVQVAQAQTPGQMSDAEALEALGATAVAPRQRRSMNTLLEAAQNPWLSDSQRSIVNALLQQEMQKQDPMHQMQLEKARLELEALRNPQPKQTDDMREYEFARQQGYQGTFQDYMSDMRRAGATNVTTNVGQGSSEYNKALDKKFAEQYINIQDGAQQARNKLATLQGLGTALGQSGYTGMGAETMLAMKQAGRMLGFEIGDDLGPQETARALGNQLALQLRNPSGGAGMPGAMSDKDREFLVASVPGLTKTPEGNQRLIEFMTRIEKRNIEVAQLAQEYADRNGQIDNGFHQELARWSEENPLFPEGDGSPGVEDAAIPEGIDPSDWEFMTPEEKALFR